MAETNKILTVSYGTFSCTLEGFDDAFGTMKAIAEYFRDLAADDRYFGAEPPQPDAEMLARIAQKEAARRVDARQDASGILLRASDTAEAAPAMPAAQVAAPIAQPAVEPAPAEPATPPGPDSLYSDEDSSVVAPTWGAPVEWDDDDIADPEPVAAEPKRSAPVAAPAANHDMFADKLARIRAVVGNPRPIRPVANDVANNLDDITATEESTFEAALADAIVDTTADAKMLTEGFAEEEKSIEAVEDTVEDTAETAAFDQANDPAYDLNVALPQVDDSTVIRTPVEPISPLSEAEEDAADNLFDTVATQDDGDDVMIHNILSDLDVDAAPADDEALQADDRPAPVQDVATDEAKAPQPASIVRAVKVKRADLEEAIASGTLEEVTDEPASSLSEQDEAELQAELQAVAAELAEAQAALNPPDEDDAPNTPALPTPSVLTLGSDAAVSRETPAAKIESSKPDLSRLMAEANSKMDEPESSSRREAYAHLRAAVAAAEAEGSLGDGLTKDESDAAYREDLASVVRPRRPGSAEGPVRPRRLTDAEGPTPLKLVAEQRIDADDVLPQRGPIRPRRIVGDLDEPVDLAAEQAAGFAAFAKEMGAKGQHDLLEAAASYLAFVEGRDQFSRPQLMTRVKMVHQSGFNREDGLRTFGQLLREGKIEKTSGGRFTVSDQIGFRPDGRQAAG